MADTVLQPELPPVEPHDPIVLSEADRKRPIWEVIAERAKQIPKDVLATSPHDGAEHHDHYLYGSVKKGRRNPRKRRS